MIPSFTTADDTPAIVAVGGRPLGLLAIGGEPRGIVAIGGVATGVGS